MSEDIFVNEEQQAIEQFQERHTKAELVAFAKKVINENKQLRIRLENAEQGLRDYQETGPCSLHEAKEKMMYLKGADARKMWAIVLLSFALGVSIVSCHSNRKQLKSIQANTVRQY